MPINVLFTDCYADYNTFTELMEFEDDVLDIVMIIIWQYYPTIWYFLICIDLIVLAIN